MNTPQQPPNQYDDEISLVDLAKILIKRWKIMALVFVLVVGSALAYALSITRSYEYVSIYQVAEQAPSSNNTIGALESPASVIARVQNLHLPRVTRELRAELDVERLPFGASMENPEETLLVRMRSEAAEDNREWVEMLHERTLTQVQDEQTERLNNQRERLERQLEQAQAALDAAMQSESDSAAELVITYSARVNELEEQLEALREGKIIQASVQSSDPTGTSRSLIMALALVLGGMLAIMSAFFAQFAAAVCESIRNEKQSTSN